MNIQMLNQSLRLRPWLLALTSLCLLLLSACPSQSLQPEGKNMGTGVVQDFNIEKNIRVALYSAKDLKDHKSITLNYGLMDAYFLTLDGVTYMVDWNDLEDFKNLKKDEKLHFRATDYIARVETTGRNYYVVKLNEL